MKGVLRRAAMVVPLLTVSACGWMEVPYESGGHRPVATSTSPGTQPALSDPLFVGADTVTVGRGDTVYAISKRHKVNMRAIIDRNDLHPPYTLYVGQKLVLPRPREYEVRRGDTLWRISNTFNVSLYLTAKLNGLNRPYVIHPGQRLRLPSPQGDKATAVAVASDPVVSAPDPVPARKPAALTQTSSGVPKASGQGFLWPVRGKILSSFGPKSGGVQNDGINIAAKRGSAIQAAENGVVAYAGDRLKGLGQLVLVRHEGGWVTAYGHADALLVKRGDVVLRGQSIGKVGSTGNVKTPQLHFQLRKRGRVVNPSQYLG